MTTKAAKTNEMTEIRKNGSRSADLEETKMIMEMTRENRAPSRTFELRGATMDDVEAAHALFDICAHHMIGKPEVTLSHVQTEWTSPGFDLDKSVRIVDGPNGEIVGYVEVWDIDDPPVSIWVWGRVHPDFEGQGIGTALMEWAETRAREAISRVPHDVRVIMRSGIFSGYEPAVNLFAGREMVLDRYFLTMAAELPGTPETPVWPEGIQLRAMKGEEELRPVVQAVRDSFQDHWGYVDTPFEQEYEQWLHWIRTDEEYDPSLWFLAMEGDDIAGICLCREKSDEDPDMGWVNVLGVLRPWRRKGLGLAMLHHTFRIMKERERASVGLGVDAKSLTGATALYEKVGMHCIRQFDTYEIELRPGRDLRKKSL